MGDRSFADQGQRSERSATGDVPDLAGATAPAASRSLPQFESYDDASRTWRSLGLDDSFVEMAELISKFSFAIPTKDAIERIAAFVQQQQAAGIVEVGSGNAYWARMLADSGVDIVASDIKSRPNIWLPIRTANHEIAADYPQRALMLGCPEAVGAATSMSIDALRAYADSGGRQLIFVGEREYVTPDQTRNLRSKTGNTEFHRAINNDWQTVEVVRLPNWPLWNNELNLLIKK